MLRYYKNLAIIDYNSHILYNNRSVILAFEVTKWLKQQYRRRMKDCYIQKAVIVVLCVKQF